MEGQTRRRGVIGSLGVCIVSMPSSGSDWFTGCLSSATGMSMYRKEFFNPLTNWSMAGLFAQCMPCELPQCLRHMYTKPNAMQSTQAIDSWKISGHQLNKEVWSFTKPRIEWLVEVGFIVIALMRRTESTFPPTRARVLAWYNHLAKAEGGDIDGSPLEVATRQYSETLLKFNDACESLSVPVIWYEDVLTVSTSANLAGLLNADARSIHNTLNHTYRNVRESKARENGGGILPWKRAGENI
jgi:hypothetical protein